jgi:glucosamine 6-phosphate synthetase-like amidotransferase/phosphosugar isomerase protein
MADTGWHTEDHPELRAGPPWVMAEMIAAEPALVAELLATGTAAAEAAGPIREAVAGALAAGRPVTVVGCGTSEHAAHGVAALIAGGVAPAQRALVRARPAFAAAQDPDDGLCLAISHDGGTRATELALQAAREAGARTAVVTFDAGGSVAAAADLVLTTPRHDDSWCHTVGYVSALAAGALIAGRVGAAPDLPAGLDAAPAAERLADRRVVLCAGAGVDHVTARELALKIAEGARLPTVPMELETVLHGQLAGCEAADGLVVVAIAPGRDPERLARRLEHVARAAGAIGLPVAALLSPRFDGALAAELTPAGRLVVPEPADDLGALLGGALALQELTLALAHARGTNPDLIRREEEPWRRAAAAGEGVGAW